MTSKVKGQGQQGDMVCLTCAGHTTKFALGTLTKYQDAYDRQSRLPPRSKVKVISSHRLYISSVRLLNSGQNDVHVSLRAGGGIPCRPSNPAATLLVLILWPYF